MLPWLHSFCVTVMDTTACRLLPPPSGHDRRPIFSLYGNFKMWIRKKTEQKWDWFFFFFKKYFSTKTLKQFMGGNSFLETEVWLNTATSWWFNTATSWWFSFTQMVTQLTPKTQEAAPTFGVYSTPRLCRRFSSSLWISSSCKIAKQHFV